LKIILLKILQELKQARFALFTNDRTEQVTAKELIYKRESKHLKLNYSLVLQLLLQLHRLRKKDVKLKRSGFVIHLLDLSSCTIFMNLAQRSGKTTSWTSGLSMSEVSITQLKFKDLSIQINGIRFKMP
jgi:hypothetical protein